MSVLLYAVLDGTRVDVIGIGLEQRPLRALSRDGLTAVISDHSGRPAPRADSVRLGPGGTRAWSDACYPSGPVDTGLNG